MNRYLYVTVFFSGMTTLAMEFAASRLLGSVFGTSNLVWASIIGLILIYLTVGYFLGGRWADRSPRAEVMYTILAWGAFLGGLIPLVARPVLMLAADAFDQLQIGVLFGSFTVVLILFSIPVTLLGAISPFAIRLAIEDPQKAGTVSGRIYAISTLGSFIGTFLPVLVFIPLVGTTWTFIIFSLVLLLIALGGMLIARGWREMLRFAWMPLLLLIVGFVLASRPIKDTVGQIYETETAYNYIQVLEQDGFRMLRLNEGQGIHSMWHPSELDFHGPWEQFLAAPFFNENINHPEQVKSVAIIGLAAGTIAHQFTEVFGPIPIDGWEIDPGIISAAQKYFDMNQPNLNAIADDGRVGLERSRKQYMVIGVDAYRPPYIPWQLTTVEFFQIVRRHLTQDGVMVINVGRSPEDRRLIDGLVGTISQVFPSVFVMDVPDTLNSIIYATVQPTKIEFFYSNLLHLYTLPDIDPLLLASMERVVVNLQPTSQSQIVYTDDRAPIEWITNDMVLDYVFTGGINDLNEGSQK